MSKRLKITIDGQALYADLCEAEAPGAVAALEQAGGFESVLFAADVCYGELTFATPASDYWDEQNVREETLPGDVTFYNDWSSVCIFTQRVEQFAPGAKVAQIRPIDLPAFQELYERVWCHQGVRLRCEVVECDEAGTERHLGPASTPRHIAPPAVARFEALLRAKRDDRPRAGRMGVCLGRAREPLGHAPRAHAHGAPEERRRQDPACRRGGAVSVLLGRVWELCAHGGHAADPCGGGELP